MEKRRLSQIQLQRLFNHQLWLATNGRHGERLILNKKDFVNHTLDGVDLSQAVISNASFTRSSLRDAKFKNAELHNVSFIGCNTAVTDFTGAVLDRVCFAEANYQEAIFSEVDLAQTFWTKDDGFYRPVVVHD